MACEKDKVWKECRKTPCSEWKVEPADILTENFREGCPQFSYTKCHMKYCPKTSFLLGIRFGATTFYMSKVVQFSLRICLPCRCDKETWQFIYSLKELAKYQENENMKVGGGDFLEVFGR